MQYTTFPKTDLKISKIALGTWVFSGGGTWGQFDEQDAIAAVHAAIDCGMTFIDTAPIYGYGQAERIVGTALKGYREKVIIATKCGLLGRGKNIVNNLKPESIERELHESLERLQVDCIDIYQCHWPDPNTPVEEIMACLKKFQAQGKIKHIGVSNFDVGLMKQALTVAPVRTLQSPLSLLNRALQKDVLPFCQQHEIGVLAYGPLAGGILSGKYKTPKTFAKSDARSFFYPYYQGERYKAVTGFLNDLAGLGRPLDQLAINWVRQQPGVAGVLVGCRNPQQVERNAAAADWDLSGEQLRFIDERISRLS